MPRLKIALLGSPEILLDGQIVHTDRRKAVALLAYLACTGNSQTRDHLAALMWPEYRQESANAYLRRTLWELNQVLGKGWLVQDRERVAIAPSDEFWLDTACLESFLNSNQPEPDALMQAVDLYRGDFLEGFKVVDTAPFEDWQTRQAAYFHRKVVDALEKLVRAFISERGYDQALSYARRWLGLDPLDEAAHSAIMHLLAEMGDRTGAIRQYEACAQILKKELGVSPQPETTRLYSEILRGEVSASEHVRISSPWAEKPVQNVRLPEMPTPFIGRRGEVEQIKILLQQPKQRLVTLIGTGGTGKTRLSIQVASEVRDLFPDGVFFTPLAAVSTPESVLSALADALGISFYEKEHPRRQIIDYMRSKQLLLVLDNFEHLLDAADLIVDILSNAPAVKVLATSRLRLNVQGEQLYQVGGMHAPLLEETLTWEDPETQAQAFSAVQLFLERARRVKPNFELSIRNLAHVLEICHLVQGLPLGLELAAAWLELLQPAEIANEIRHSLDILETNHLDVPERQRSIRAVFESSWKLLSEAEQIALQRLCVFRGSFSREAAQQVSGANLRELLGLVDKSWLQQIEDGRFQLHELLKHYGQEQLRSNAGEWKTAHDRHAAYFTRFVTEQNNRLRGTEQLAGKQALEKEFNTNIKAAWEWLLARRQWTELLDPFASGLLHLSTLRGQMEELIPWLREARIILAEHPETAVSLACAIISTFEIFCEENEYILENHPDVRMAATWQTVLKHQQAEPMGLWFVLLAFMVHNRNLDPNAEALLIEAVSRIRRENDPWKLGTALYIQAVRGGMYALDREILLEAEQIFKKQGACYERGLIAELLGSQAIHQKQPLYVILEYYNQAKQFFTLMGDEARAILNFLDLAGLFFRVGLSEQGFDIYQETQRVLQNVGNTRMLANSLHWESIHATRYSTLDHALTTRKRNLELTQKTQNLTDYSLGLLETGEIYRIFGDADQARNYYEEAYPGLRRLNLVLGLGYYERAYGDLALQAGCYEEAMVWYERYVQYATQDNHPWSMAQARAKRALALAYLENCEQARREMGELIKEIRGWGEDELLLIALLTEIVCLLQEGKPKQATELAAFIRKHPVSWNEIRQQAHTMLEKASSAIPSEAVQAAIEHGEAMKLDAVLNTILGQAV